MTRQLALFIGVSLLIASLIPAAGAAQRRHRQTFSMSTGPGPVTDCSNVRLTVDDLEVARSDQEQSIPSSAISSLHVESVERGGVSVIGWDRGDYSIQACMAAAGETTTEAQQILTRITVSVHDGRVGVDGPSGEDWMAFLIIHAPRGAVIELESKNGPIGVSGFSGTIRARSLNGPISLSDVDGVVQADVVNGPVNVRGNRGDYKLNIENGPLNVRLTGNRWESGELEGHTQNGPINLNLPEGYQSSVRVDASRHSPVTCRAVQCKEAARTWDAPNRIAFGTSNPVVRLSTVNGPVSIKTAEY
jgi:hypothetical protein